VERPPTRRASAGESPAAPPITANRADHKKRDKRIRKIDEEIAALEERIASAERERERNDLLLCSEEVYRDGEKTKKIQARNADIAGMIKLLYAKWEELSRQKEELESSAGSA
jgi:predicted RNase H-like nuclease (RuvC/YqgF family)